MCADAGLGFLSREEASPTPTLPSPSPAPRRHLKLERYRRGGHDSSK
jgi:hypothetical protein